MFSTVVTEVLAALAAVFRKPRDFLRLEPVTVVVSLLVATGVVAAGAASSVASALKVWLE